MNIEKIKNYNQKMLAIITTAAVVFAVIGLLSFIFFLLTDVFRVFSNHSTDYQAEGIPSEETVYGEAEEEKTEMFVSYRFPHLVDTSKQIFVIPVTHQTEDEIRDDYSRKISFSGLGSYDGYDYYSTSFINLLIYNAITNQHQKLFKQPIIIGEYRPVYFKDDIHLIFEAADEDTDKDGMINLSDNTSLFIYSINNKTLKQAKMQEKTILQYRLISKSKDLIIRFGANPNKRKRDKTSFDPGVLCKYSYENDRLLNINDEKLNTELKKIAEGGKATSKN